MPKHPNPVRGYCRCPVCSAVSTVHQVGEGQLIATGEPPKNSRNIGLQYYKCPDCGNSAISKRIDSYITDNIEETAEAVTFRLQPLSTEEKQVIEGDFIPKFNASKPDTVTERVTEQVTEAVKTDEASKDGVSNRDVTEKKITIKVPQFVTKKRVMLAVIGVVVIGLMVKLLMPKKPKLTEPTQGGDHVGNV